MQADIDVALLSKMERGERKFSKELVLKLAELYKANSEKLVIDYLSEKVLYELEDEDFGLEALKVAEKQLKYIKNKPEKMKIKRVTIHNFRSILHQTIYCNDFTLFVGENNSGKTNIITALRAFYENEGYKYDKKSDFPKLSSTNDTESWIEIEFITTEEEQRSLKDEYKRDDKILTVRRYFESADKVKKDNSNIFYIAKDGTISENNFYGAKNVSQAKLGKIIYIPEIAKTDDTFKLTGPSPLRQILNFVFKKVIEKSQVFTNLDKAFQNFNNDFKTEVSSDGISMERLKEDINNELKNWQFSFGFDINPINTDLIIKNLIDHYIEDDNLEVGKKRVDIKNIGQGLQRHLIYTMIKLAAKYDESKKETDKKNFTPTLL